MASRKKLEVSVIQQDFTNTEKAQARTNIDAAAISSVNKNESDIADIISSATNWQNTYGIVSTQSASWNNKVDTNTFIPVAEDVDTLKANSAKLTVTGDGQRITVSTNSNTAQVSFNSAGLASETWVSAQIDELGKFQIVSADADGKPAVQNPDDKTVYIVQESEGTSGGFTEWIWTQNGGYEQFGGFEIDLSPYQKQISAGNGIEITGPNNNFISVTGDITPYSGTGIISVQDHIISALTAEIHGGNGIGVNYGDNTISLSVSADYLSANSLNDLSGNWESTYNTVQSNSAIWSNVTAKADKSWTEETFLGKSQYSADSATFLTAIPPEYTTTSDLEVLSGEIISQIPSTAGLASETYVNSQVDKKLDTSAYASQSGNFLTAHQSLVGLMSANLLGTENDLITGYNGTAFSAGLTYKGGSYVEISGDTITVTGLQPSGNYVTTNEFSNLSGIVEELQTNSASWDDVSAKLDKTEAIQLYQPKGTYVSSNEFNALSSIVEDLVENSAHNTISSLNNYIHVSEGAANETDIEFISGDLATKTWVDENYSGDYLSANALDNLSGKWESASNAVTISSNRWNSLFNTTVESTDGTVVITPHTNQNGDVLYDLAVSAEPVVCDTKLEANNGISAQFRANGTQSAWYIGLENTAHSAIEDVINNKAIWNTVTNKLDSTAFSTVSSNFATELDLQTLSGELESKIPSTAGLATETYVDAGLSSKVDYTTFSSTLEEHYATLDDLIGFATEQYVQTTSAAITAMIPSTAGLASETYVQQNTSGKADKSEIPDVSNFITNTSAEQTYQKIEDMTAYQAAGNYLSSNALNGYATQDWVTGQNYITGVDLTPYQTTAGMTAYQPIGDYATNTDLQFVSGALTGFASTAQLTAVTSDVFTLKTASSTWDAVTAKLDETAFSTVSSTFLTAHQSLSNYYMKSETSGASELDAALSAKQDSLSQSQLSAISSVSSKLNTTAFSTVSGNFVQSTGTNAIKTVLMVSQLPASPSTSVLYLIPE